MLPHYSSLKVAEQFRVLEAIAPGRIDLGLGRAPGSDGRTAFALNPLAETAADHFPAQVRDLLAWLAGREAGRGPSVPRHHRPARRADRAGGLDARQLRLRRRRSRRISACRSASRISSPTAAASSRRWRCTAKATGRANAIPQPYAALCVWALAADTEAEAARLFTSREMWRLGRDRGVFAPLPSPEEAAAHPLFRGRTAARRAPALTRALWHAGGRGGEAARTGGGAWREEIAILTTLHDPEARRRSYTLLAREFGLAAQVPLAAE